ncbi:MAG: LUD domain-containing protein [Planctomycetes bacterium]|nr:LUD domain-containing protein [Planctomycetota bacterium]
MSSKQHILAAIRKLTLPAVDLPVTSPFGIVYDDPLQQFATVLQAVGGLAKRIANIAELKRELALLDVYRQAKRIYSARADIEPGNVNLGELADPKQLHGLDLAILNGDFGVAENGAVWVRCDDLSHRAVHVIAEHLVLIVAADQIVHNMHQAYDRLAFSEPSYRLFISGPSKTADIEQSLVIGAQGPRSLVVFLVG